MKKNVKQIFALSIAAAMLLTGCGDGKGSAGKSKDADKLTEKGTYPIVKEGEEVKLSIFAPLRAGIQSYETQDNAFTKWIEDKTGLDLDWQVVPLADRQTKLNLFMTGGTYPDVILDHYWSPSEQLLYGEQGAIIPLQDLIAEYGPNIQKALDDNPLVKNNLVMEDGNIYSIPTVGAAQHMQCAKKMWINQTWLDNLGLEMPQTTEDFYNVLKAFKEKDANGNGDPNDEVPMSGSLTGWNTDTMEALMNSFVYYDKGKNSLFVKDGKVVFSKNTDEWKDGLEYMNKLYSEELIDPLYFSQNADELKKLANAPDAAKVGVCGGGSIGAFIQLGDSDRWLEYAAMPPLEGPKGVRNSIYMPNYGDPVLSITDKCANPEVVIRLFDLMFTEEGFMGNHTGVKGTDYVDATDDMVNVVGEKPRFERLTNDAEREGRYWNQLGPWYRDPEFELWFNANPDGDIEATLYNATVDCYLPYIPAVENLIPPLSFGKEDSRILVDIQTAMNVSVDEATAAFVTGTRSLDEWDAYKATVEELGIKEYIDVYQKALDAKNKK